ncbi:MAG: cyclase family protein [Solirubrobacteraceae bacterium]|nr:cyclase family protein [Patulibacter sp.]
MSRPLTDLLAELRACTWVDLTHAFEPGIPHYVGFPDEERTTLFHFDEGVGTDGSGFLAHRYSHIGQWGTHMDPPAHFIRGGRFQDEVPVTEMILPLVVLDARDRVAADVDYAADTALISEHEAVHGRIPDGAFVALLTGWAERWPDADAMQNRDAAGGAHYPGWGVDALELLVHERGITAIGHDTTDTDPGALVSAGTYPAETCILAADRWQIELLANLDQVPPAGALVVATWPKPREGSGFPARVFAIVP